MGTKTILLVDDNSQVRDLYSRIFTLECGYIVTFAHDGVEAEALLFDGKFLPNFLLTDYLMPRRNGIEVLRRLHNEGVLSRIEKVALCTATPERELEAEVKSYGVGYFTKPFTACELLDYFSIPGVDK